MDGIAVHDEWKRFPDASALGGRGAHREDDVCMQKRGGTRKG